MASRLKGNSTVTNDGYGPVVVRLLRRSNSLRNNLKGVAWVRPRLLQVIEFLLKVGGLLMMTGCLEVFEEG